ncbi:MAG: response regulator [Myxococcota bacterium]
MHDTGLRDLQLLVVEDSPEDAELVRRALSSQPFLEIDVVGDGADALKYLAGSTPDLILLDLYLPRIDGFEVLAWLKESGRSIPTLVLSGAAAEDVRTRVYELGALTMVQKPRNRGEFQVFVRSMFDLWMRSLLN